MRTKLNKCGTKCGCQQSMHLMNVFFNLTTPMGNLFPQTLIEKAFARTHPSPGIGADGAKAIAAVLAQSKLTELNLRFNSAMAAGSHSSSFVTKSQKVFER